MVTEYDLTKKGLKRKQCVRFSWSASVAGYDLTKKGLERLDDSLRLLKAHSYRVRPDEKGIETAPVAPSCGRPILVTEDDLTKKGLKLVERARRGHGHVVTGYDLTKKGLKHLCASRALLDSVSYRARPDEKGIGTAPLLHQPYVPPVLQRTT